VQLSTGGCIYGKIQVLQIGYKSEHNATQVLFMIFVSCCLSKAALSYSYLLSKQTQFLK